MENLIQKYNRFLIFIFSIAPFAGWFMESYLDMDIRRMIQALSFLGIFLLIVIRNKSNPIKFPNYLLYYLLFIIYNFYSTKFILNREIKIMYLFSNPLIGGLIFMFIIENLTLSKKYFKFLLNVSMIVLIIAFIVIIIQQSIDPGFFVRKDFHAMKNVVSEGENKNRLFSIYSWAGGFLAIGFGFVPVFILVVEDLIKKNKKVLLFILMGLTFALLSKARWIMLNSLLVFVLLFINYKFKPKYLLKYLILLPLIFFVATISLNSAGIDVKGIVSERILESDKNNLKEKSASSRILAFKAFNELYWDNPIFGVGDIKYGMGSEGKQGYRLNRFLRGRSAQIHVGYLSLLYRFGIIGAILYLSFLFFLLKKLYNNAKKTKIWAPFLGFLGIAVANLTLVNFSIYEMGLIIVLVADRYYMYNRNIIEKINV